MNMNLIDWAFVVGLLALMVAGVILSKSYMRSVADFLAAGRTAGRYVICISLGMSGLGAISIIAILEMNYIAGFSMTWWGFSMGVVSFFIAISGWVTYRFRQTRALTMAQFFEIRYGRNFRIFAGIVAFVTGIVNFGIFPAVGARFFIYFCGFPLTISIFGLDISTFAVVMIFLLLISLYFVFSGGQIAVIITDFIQGLFVSIIFIIIIIVILEKFEWLQLFDGLKTAPANESLINPFHTSSVKDFNIWFYLIGVVGAVYNCLGWQGGQAYNCSARNAHEAKMATVLGAWRGIPQNILLLLLPIIAYVVMHHPDFLLHSEKVNAILGGLEADTDKSQLMVPLVLTQLLPKGLMGAFAAVMLAAFISTHDTYLHSWGTILIQDVIMPFRKKPFEPQQHIRVLRIAIIGVAVFIFFFGLLFKQSQYILLFFAVTAAIYLGGSGAVIIGGLYWKRGTATAAWFAMIFGATIAVGGIVLHQIDKEFFINGQVFWFIAMLCSSLSYVFISLLGKKRDFNMDKLLHRGKYAVKDETIIVTPEPGKGFKMLGMGKEFTHGDKIIYIASYVWTFCWLVVFIIGTIYNLTHEVKDAAWMRFWRIYILINLTVSIGVVVWFIFGGLRDLKAMFQRLKIMKRDQQDDGTVFEHAGSNLSESA